MSNLSDFQLNQTARLLNQGAVIAYPTEAVYGLGCDPTNARAVTRLLAIKRRPVEKGLILIASSLEQLQPFVQLRDEWVSTLNETWPGPHTWLLPAAENLPYWINGGRDSVACRVTAHPLAAALCTRFGGPLISTSANQLGHPPARSAVQVRLRCHGVDRILCGQLGGLSRPTPIHDLRSGKQLRA